MQVLIYVKPNQPRPWIIHQVGPELVSSFERVEIYCPCESHNTARHLNLKQQPGRFCLTANCQIEYQGNTAVLLPPHETEE